MAQRDGGVFLDPRRVLGASAVYQAFQDVLGADAFRRRLAAWIDAAPGQRVLDIGCGPAAILEHLPAGIDYHGFDDSADYIAAARARWGGRGHFWQARLSGERSERFGADGTGDRAGPDDRTRSAQPSPVATLAELGAFDRVIAIGVLHHLDDAAAAALVDLAAHALAPGGMLLTYDPCWAAHQGVIARALIARDRGQDVRDAHGYARLARARFATVEPEVVSGHLRVPYTACVLRCRN